MSIIVYDNSIENEDRIYLLKTSNDLQNTEIISRLFYNGNIVYKKIIPIDNINGTHLNDIVNNYHKEHLQEIDYLITLQKKFLHLPHDYQFLLCKALYNKGMYEEIIPILSELLSHNNGEDKRDQIFFYLGKINDKLENFDEAIKLYNGAIYLKPFYPDYHNCLGETYLKIEKTKDSIDNFNEAIDLNIYFADAYFNLGLAYLQNYINKKDYSLSKDFPENCIKNFSQAVEFKPNLKDDYYVNGFQLLEKEKWDDAYSSFFKTKEKQNSNFDFIYDFYIKILRADDIELDEISLYVEKLENQVKKNPYYPDLLNELGIAYLFYSKVLSNKAIKKFEQSVQLNQNYDKAKKNLKLIQSESIGYEQILKVVVK